MKDFDNKKTVLKVEGLTTEFKTYNGIVHAVNQVSYELKEGELLTVVGESGCGKSVHAMSMMQLIESPPGRIVAGSAVLDDIDLLKLNKKEINKVRGKDISMIFQDPMTSLNPVLPVGVQIEECLITHLKMKKSEARERTLELFKLVGIPCPEERLKQYPFQFSGGMRQRVMIAIGICCNPKVLIADEPTTALDVTIQAQILELIKELNRSLNMAVIWITHDLGVVAEIADRVNVMYGGRIVERGTVYQIFEHPTHPYTHGLLQARPHVDIKQGKKKKLKSINGSPIILRGEQVGCPFAPRCPYVINECRTREVKNYYCDGNTHSTACFRWKEIEEARYGK